MRTEPSWTKVEGATGYQVYRYDAAKGKYVLKASTTDNAYTDSKVSVGKTYKYKIRAVRTVNGKAVYSSYSKEKSIKAVK